MENATKALLIAAAVLVAILIISLGIGIYNMASEQVNNSDLTEYEIQKFNQKFTKYEGRSVSASEVNALLNTVFYHNMAQDDDTTCVWVVYEPSGGPRTMLIDSVNNLENTPPTVSAGRRYMVALDYNCTTKLVRSIQIH